MFIQRCCILSRFGPVGPQVECKSGTASGVQKWTEQTDCEVAQTKWRKKTLLGKWATTMTHLLVVLLRDMACADCITLVIQSASLLVLKIQVRQQ